MATIRCVLNNWGLAHNHGSDLSLRMAAAEILRDGCSSGGQIPTSEECRALEAFSRGASLDDPCPVDAADQVAILCAAIDDGDDTALLALADWLEERGDRKAEGLRHRRVGLIWPAAWGSMWAWERRFFVVENEWARLSAEHNGLREGSGCILLYPTRSAAYLALATALMESTHAD